MPKPSFETEQFRTDAPLAVIITPESNVVRSRPELRSTSPSTAVSGAEMVKMVPEPSASMVGEFVPMSRMLFCKHHVFMKRRRAGDNQSIPGLRGQDRLCNGIRNRNGGFGAKRCSAQEQ